MGGSFWKKNACSFACPQNTTLACAHPRTEVPRVAEKNIVRDRAMKGWGRRRSVETGGRGGGAFVALRHAEKNSPQRHAATTGARASVRPSLPTGCNRHDASYCHTRTYNSLSLFFTPSSCSSFTLPSPNITELCRI